MCDLHLRADIGDLLPVPITARASKNTGRGAQRASALWYVLALIYRLSILLALAAGIQKTFLQFTIPLISPTLAFVLAVIPVIKLADSVVSTLWCVLVEYVLCVKRVFWFIWLCVKTVFTGNHLHIANALAALTRTPSDFVLAILEGIPANAKGYYPAYGGEWLVLSFVADLVAWYHTRPTLRSMALSFIIKAIAPAVMVLVMKLYYVSIGLAGWKGVKHWRNFPDGYFVHTASGELGDAPRVYNTKPERPVVFGPWRKVTVTVEKVIKDESFDSELEFEDGPLGWSDDHSEEIEYEDEYPEGFYVEYEDEEAEYYDAEFEDCTPEVESEDERHYASDSEVESECDRCSSTPPVSDTESSDGETVVDDLCENLETLDFVPRRSTRIPTLKKLRDEKERIERERLRKERKEKEKKKQERAVKKMIGRRAWSA